MIQPFFSNYKCFLSFVSLDHSVHIFEEWHPLFSFFPKIARCFPLVGDAKGVWQRQSSIRRCQHFSSSSFRDRKCNFYTRKLLLRLWRSRESAMLTTRNILFPRLGEQHFFSCLPPYRWTRGNRFAQINAWLFFRLSQPCRLMWVIWVNADPTYP